MRILAKIKPKWYNESHKKEAMRKERKCAKKYGGKAVRGSGSGFRKGDVSIPLEKTLAEHKFTNSTQFILKLVDFEKIQKEAVNEGKDPIMVIDYKKYGKVLIVMDESRYLHIINRTKEIR